MVTIWLLMSFLPQTSFYTDVNLLKLKLRLNINAVSIIPVFQF